MVKNGYSPVMEFWDEADQLMDAYTVLWKDPRRQYDDQVLRGAKYIIAVRDKQAAEVCDRITGLADQCGLGKRGKKWQPRIHVLRTASSDITLSMTQAKSVEATTVRQEAERADFILGELAKEKAIDIARVRAESLTPREAEAAVRKVKAAAAEEAAAETEAKRCLLEYAQQYGMDAPLKLVHDTGMAYRLTYFDGTRRKQSSVGDFCILVSESPDKLKLLAKGTRKKRSDTKSQQDPDVIAVHCTEAYCRRPL